MANLLFILFLALFSPFICAQEAGQQFTGVAGNTTIAGNPLGPDSNGKYEINGPGIRALFVPYGASISNLFLNDSSGTERDIVGGWDNASYYGIDKQHPHFGAVPGRYANRIKNSSFEIDGQLYHILPNENPTPANPQGIDTLHGGPDGWDWRNDVGLKDDGDCDDEEDADYVEFSQIPNEEQVYWNLDGYSNNETATILNHSLYLPYAGQRISTDPILIPDGPILSNEPQSGNDFWTSPKQIGANFTSPSLLGNCGFNCTGYDTAYVHSRRLPPYDWKAAPVARLRSAWSGIQLDVYSDQLAFQVYSCGGQNGSVALKTTQDFDRRRERLHESRLRNVSTRLHAYVSRIKVRPAEDRQYGRAATLEQTGGPSHTRGTPDITFFQHRPPPLQTPHTRAEHTRAEHTYPTKLHSTRSEPPYLQPSDPDPLTHICWWKEWTEWEEIPSQDPHPQAHAHTHAHAHAPSGTAHTPQDCLDPKAVASQLARCGASIITKGFWIWSAASHFCAGQSAPRSDLLAGCAPPLAPELGWAIKGPWEVPFGAEQESSSVCVGGRSNQTRGPWAAAALLPLSLQPQPDLYDRLPPPPPPPPPHQYAQIDRARATLSDPCRRYLPRTIVGLTCPGPSSACNLLASSSLLLRSIHLDDDDDETPPPLPPTASLGALRGAFTKSEPHHSMERGATEYSQSGLQSPYPNALNDAESKESSADHPSAAQYAPEVRSDSVVNSYSSSATPTSELGLYPASARSTGSYPEHITRQYHQAAGNDSGGSASMAQQAPSPSTTNHQNTQNKSDQDVPIDPSIAASSPNYPPHNPQYSSYPSQSEMPHGYPSHTAGAPMFPPQRPDWAGYGGAPPPNGLPPNGLPGAYHPVSGAQTPTSAAPAGVRGQVYSFVPIPGAQQHKRPRRRYEEIERMYKCGWNGCEKAYGTLNHLNAHVTMQSHGQKRTPEAAK
ncbi:hypothetical protein B7494_g8367 [Chlorociboria aeruginascens]|nr:hypothetical protein B7494_g8367 [Chlorociboria aeruginascens]